jgi:hypothetical protein
MRCKGGWCARRNNVKIRVECYSGRKADERPVQFWLGDQVLVVQSIEDTWYSPDSVYFRVLADDRNAYVLGHNETTDEWTLESFRSQESPGGFDPYFEPPSSVH